MHVESYHALIVYIAHCVILTNLTGASKVRIVCKNLRPNCHSMAAKNMCVTQPVFMKKLCKRTCNLCSGEIKKRVNKDLKTSLLSFGNIKKASSPALLCEDKSRGCEKFRLSGWCHTKKRIAVKICKKECGLCNDVKKKLDKLVINNLYYSANRKPTASPIPQQSCMDKGNNCDRLDKQYGLCKKRKQSMKKLCKKTCGFCEEKKSFTVVWKAVTKTPVVEHKTPTLINKKPDTNCVNKWPRPRCAYYSHLGWCDKHAEITENCQQTCVCNSQPAKQKTCPNGGNIENNCNKVCEDDQRFKVLCNKFGSDCDGNGGLAKSLNRYCTKTCNLCS